MYAMKVPFPPVIVHPRLKRSKAKEEDDLSNLLRDLRSCRASLKQVSDKEILVTIDRDQ